MIFPVRRKGKPHDQGDPQWVLQTDVLHRGSAWVGSRLANGRSLLNSGGDSRLSLPLAKMRRVRLLYGCGLASYDLHSGQRRLART